MIFKKTTSSFVFVFLQHLEIKSDPLEYLDVPVPDIQHSLGVTDTSLVCYLCNERFENIKQCQQHITKHSDSRNSCHLNTDNKSKKYFCEICGKKCDRRHFFIHSDKKHTCKICGKLFNSPT